MQGQAFLELIASRHSCRSFKPDSVPRELLERILDASKNAPSSQNNQPWHCMVLTGALRNALSEALLNAPDTEKKPDYVNRPKELTKLQQEGIDSYAKWYYEDQHNIPRSDTVSRAKLHKENFTFYGAPVHVLVFLPKKAVEGTFLDAGFFIQNILLGCHANGLGALPQYSVASFAPIVKKIVGLKDDDYSLVCGISIGYPNAPIQGPPRFGLDVFVEWK